MQTSVGHKHRRYFNFVDLQLCKSIFFGELIDIQYFSIKFVETINFNLKAEHVLRPS